MQIELRSEINDKSTILNYPPTSMKDFVSHLASAAKLADLFLPEPLLFYEQFAREGYSGRRQQPPDIEEERVSSACFQSNSPRKVSLGATRCGFGGKSSEIKIFLMTCQIWSDRADSQKAY